ncbi:RNA dependent RNA polymerase-domain-containing protein [Melanogaster broomeanus]|nr:RNA dependent RNA polymerase-domain-containing protein [Melanogaster broomeanus]
MASIPSVITSASDLNRALLLMARPAMLPHDSLILYVTSPKSVGARRGQSASATPFQLGSSKDPLPNGNGFASSSAILLNGNLGHSFLTLKTPTFPAFKLSTPTTLLKVSDLGLFFPINIADKILQWRNPTVLIPFGGAAVQDEHDPAALTSVIPAECLPDETRVLCPYVRYRPRTNRTSRCKLVPQRRNFPLPAVLADRLMRAVEVYLKNNSDPKDDSLPLPQALHEDLSKLQQDLDSSITEPLGRWYHPLRSDGITHFDSLYRDDEARNLRCAKPPRKVFPISTEPAREIWRANQRSKERPARGKIPRVFQFRVPGAWSYRTPRLLRAKSSVYDPRSERSIAQTRILCELKHRARSAVPGSFKLLGVSDECDCLDEGNAYASFQDKRTGLEPQESIDKVAIMCSPHMHPGDVQVVTAVRRSQLEHPTNVVVFTCRCSSSDQGQSC